MADELIVEYVDPCLGQSFRIDLNQGHDISIPLQPLANTEEIPQAFHLPTPTCHPVKIGSFVGDVNEGASVNVFTLVSNFHGSVTHTECVGHIIPEYITLADISLSSFMLPACLISVQLEVK